MPVMTWAAVSSLEGAYSRIQQLAKTCGLLIDLPSIILAHSCTLCSGVNHIIV